MNAPIRWKDTGSEASRELRAVMEYAHERRPEEAQIAALIAAVLPQVGSVPAPAPSPAPVAATSAGVTAGLSSAAKLGLLALVAGASGAIAMVWHGAQPAPQRDAGAERARAAITQPSSTPASPTEPSAQLPPDPAPAAQGVAPSQDPPQRAERRAPRARALPDAPALPAPAAQDDELRLLHAARRARADAPERALALLDEHLRRFPESQLSEEREALRIELLWRVDPARAEAQLRAFDALYPRSPYRARLVREARTSE